MLEDQQYILAEILRIAGEEAPDAVLIAGDVYDKSVPPAEAVELFRFFSGHITEFYDERGRCLLRLPPVERREIEIAALQPTQFSVDRDKCAAVSRFIRSAGDLVVPVTVLDGALCTLDGHTRLYTAWQMGIRTAMAFDSPLEPEQKALFAGIVQEARRRGVFRVEDMALYSHE